MSRPCKTCGGVLRLADGHCIACRRVDNRRRRAANIEKSRAACRRWQIDHRKQACASTRRWQIANPEKVREAKRHYRAALKGALRDGSHKCWEARLLQHDGSCIYCGCFRALTLDHFQPLSKGGPHTLTNFIPACASCNAKKNDAVVDLGVAHQVDAETTKRVLDFVARSRRFLAETAGL